MRRIYLKRPEFFLQPARILKRLFIRARQIEICKTSWGAEMEVNTDDVVGKSIFFTGIYDLAVSELLWKLVKPGQFVVDVGANIGFTAGICSSRAGREGVVYAFEPNPRLQKRLHYNIDKMSVKNVQLFSFGLSDERHTGKLVFPEHYDNNEGVAYVDDTSTASNVEIQLEKLDDVIPAEKVIDVMKIDVEGYEMNVFNGSRKLLTEKRIRHIIFEDHHKYPSKVSILLKENGYSIYRLEKGWFNILLKDPYAKSSVSGYEPSNYLATLDNDDVSKEIGKFGYQCLRFL